MPGMYGASCSTSLDLIGLFPIFLVEETMISTDRTSDLGTCLSGDGENLGSLLDPASPQSFLKAPSP